MTTTARQTPSGVKPENGFSTKIAFAADPDIAFWEKNVKPPGVDGGDAIDTTTMFNTVWRTMAPRSLKTLTNVTVKAAYDPRLYDQIVALINVPGWITIHFWNNDTLDFYGYLKSFTPGDLVVDSAQPEADIEIVCTNTVPATGAESSPDLMEAAGTFV